MDVEKTPSDIKDQPIDMDDPQQQWPLKKGCTLIHPRAIVFSE
jgi:hypothetical protein